MKNIDDPHEAIVVKIPEVKIHRPLPFTIKAWSSEGLRVVIPRGNPAEYSFAVVELRDDTSEPELGYYTWKLRIRHVVSDIEGCSYSFTSYIDALDLWRQLAQLGGYTNESLATFFLSSTGEKSIRPLFSSLRNSSDDRDSYIAHIQHGHFDGQQYHTPDSSVLRIVEKHFGCMIDVSWCCAESDYLFLRFHHIYGSIYTLCGPELAEDAEIFINIPAMDVLWKVSCEPDCGLESGSWKWDGNPPPGRFELTHVQCNPPGKASRLGKAGDEPQENEEI